MTWGEVRSLTCFMSCHGFSPVLPHGFPRLLGTCEWVMLSSSVLRADRKGVSGSGWSVYVGWKRVISVCRGEISVYEVLPYMGPRWGLLYFFPLIWNLLFSWCLIFFFPFLCYFESFNWVLWAELCHSPKSICWSPSTQYFRMWLYFGEGL